MSKNQDLRKNFSENLKFLMKSRNVTQQILAEATETTRQAVAQYADGTAIPSVEKLHKISKFFNMSMDYFFNPINAISINDSNISVKDVCDFTGLDEKSVSILKSSRALSPHTIYVVNLLLRNLFSKELKNRNNKSVIDALAAYYFFNPKKTLETDELFAITSNGKEDGIQKIKHFEHNGVEWFEPDQTPLYPELLNETLLSNIKSSVKESKEKITKWENNNYVNQKNK